VAAPVAAAENLTHELQNHNENDEAQEAAPYTVTVTAAISPTQTVKHRHLSFFGFLYFRLSTVAVPSAKQSAEQGNRQKWYEYARAVAAATATLFGKAVAVATTIIRIAVHQTSSLVSRIKGTAASKRCIVHGMNAEVLLRLPAKEYFMRGPAK